MGTWGPGAFDNDDALDLLGALTGRDPVSRRQTLERIFRTTREHPQDLNWTLGPAKVVAAAALVAASLPAGEAVVREITGHHHDAAVLVIPDGDPGLAGDDPDACWPSPGATGKPAPGGFLRPRQG